MTAFDVIFIEGDLSIEESLNLFLQANQIPDEEVNFKDNTTLNAYAEWNNYATLKINANTGIPTFLSQKYLNFPASTALSFTPLNERTRPLVQTALLRTALVIIKEWQWNVGIMLENLAETVLLYKDGTLKIREHEFWNEERLDMLDLPYTEENLYSTYDTDITEDM